MTTSSDVLKMHGFYPLDDWANKTLRVLVAGPFGKLI